MKNLNRHEVFEKVLKKIFVRDVHVRKKGEGNFVSQANDVRNSCLSKMLSLSHMRPLDEITSGELVTASCYFL